MKSKLMKINTDIDVESEEERIAQNKENNKFKINTTN